MNNKDISEVSVLQGILDKSVVKKPKTIKGKLWGKFSGNVYASSMDELVDYIKIHNGIIIGNIFQIGIKQGKSINTKYGCYVDFPILYRI